jgi:hypothetical protein
MRLVVATAIGRQVELPLSLPKASERFPRTQRCLGAKDGRDVRVHAGLAS